MVQVNLLRKRYAITDKQYRQERTILTWSISGFLVVVVLAVAVSAFQMILSSRLASTNDEISKTKAKLGTLQQANAKQLYLKNRLGLIKDLISSRVAHREALQQLFSLNFPGLRITRTTFQSDTSVKLDISADSLMALDQAWDYFEKPDQFFPQVVNTGVIRGKDGYYTMGLLLTLPKQEVAYAEE